MCVRHISESVEIGLIGGFFVDVDCAGEFVFFAMVGGGAEGVVAVFVFEWYFDADVDYEMLVVACASTWSRDYLMRGVIFMVYSLDRLKFITWLNYDQQSLLHSQAHSSPLHLYSANQKCL